MSADPKLLEKIVALAKRRGFVYPGSEIYGGLAGTWDYGPLGGQLRHNLKDLWWRRFVSGREDVYGLPTAIIMNPRVWEATGHTQNFTDPLPEAAGQFNVMFKTQIGAKEEESATTYLRPETAQGMFVNFKNVMDSLHPKLPFGLAQIGKAFRNEIAPRDWLFRTREFEQMELEYFVRPEEWEKYFEYWLTQMREWLAEIGLPAAKIHELEVPAEDRAHYSSRTVDFEFDFPHGRGELYGLAYRSDFDLRNHSAKSGVELAYFDEEKKEKIVPHVIEPTFGVDRTVYAVLAASYREDGPPAGGGDDIRVYLALPPKLAPITVAVFPLLKNKPQLVAYARDLFAKLKAPTQGRGPDCNVGAIAFDDNGNIGKRYRRQDEIGTPWCVTVDFQTLDDGTVTLRERDTGEQARLPAADLAAHLSQRLAA